MSAQRSGELVELEVDGQPITARSGRSIAAALLGLDEPQLRRSPGGAPRAVYCGIGVCFECRVHVEGRGAVRACVTPVEDGMRVVRSL
jgi:predicted molibdopterin-dependent oxidoreductase YjgC